MPLITHLNPPLFSKLCCLQQQKAAPYTLPSSSSCMHTCDHVSSTDTLMPQTSAHGGDIWMCDAEQEPEDFQISVFGQSESSRLHFLLFSFFPLNQLEDGSSPQLSCCASSRMSANVLF